jgi:glucose uptake protein GlcU
MLVFLCVCFFSSQTLGVSQKVLIPSIVGGMAFVLLVVGVVLVGCYCHNKKKRRKAEKEERQQRTAAMRMARVGRFCWIF